MVLVNGRLSEMKIRVPFKCVGSTDDCLLVKVSAQKLQAHRETLPTETTGNRNTRDARHVHRDCEDIHQIHLKGIFRFLSDPKCRRRGRRGENDIGIIEGVVEILLNERPHLGRLLVVGLIVAGRKRICA